MTLVGDITMPDPGASSATGGHVTGGWRVFKTGPAEEIFTCDLSDELLRRLAWPAPTID